MSPIMSRDPSRADISAAKVELDVTDADAVSRTFAELGPIDHLVSSTVARAGGPAKEIDLATARQAFEAKLWGPFAVIQAADVRGSIVLLSGVAAMTPARGGSVTAAVNGAIEALVRTLAVELAPVRVNAVSPGIVATPTWDGMPRRRPRGDVRTTRRRASCRPGRNGRRPRRRDLAPAHEHLRHRHDPEHRRRSPARGTLIARAPVAASKRLGGPVVENSLDVLGIGIVRNAP